MKVMCISDIHGNIENLKKVIEIFNKENAEKLLILGDFSSYYYSSTDFEIAEILNNMAGVIIAVKGNCDNNHLDELFNFKLGYIKTIDLNGIKVTLTHGHIYNINNLPENCGDILLMGHTHVGMIEKIGEKIIANPGSISKPRGGTKKGYIIINDDSIELKDLQGEIVKKENLKFNCRI